MMDWVVVVTGQKPVTYNNLTAEERKGLPVEVSVVLEEMYSNWTELEAVRDPDIGEEEAAAVEETGEFDC